MLFTLALLVGGSYQLTRLPIDAVPDITNNQVQVLTTAPALSALDVERLITFPIEQTMANIPKIAELRSISRFGLSVVTIVFHDNVDIYWARSQVDQRMGEAKKNIPPGIGLPEMGPISTGLGEIYQYVIHPKKGYETQFDPYELRTVQDWMVRRQLLGTPGVAEVNSFGGLLKQYEVAINPDQLRGYNLGLDQIFNALEINNQNGGGAYIEKNSEAYFIRTEGLLQSKEDIENVVVKQTETGNPIRIRDLASVKTGHAIRYGAMTRNGEGEAVGGIVMMLKGENSNDVAKRVREKVARIQKSLPKGLVIEPYLDRTELVNRAINTVGRNLLEGALIVIFVLVLFLGNFRAGLLVASVIPLSMLFAVCCMNFFGVSGNLMSLGAIDFGLIVDGSVIIVEATLHHLSKVGGKRLSKSEMDMEVYHSASKIRSAAAFGEIIILLVYLPILALSGVEGKMFVPMAETVIFAISGAFILSLTYVPMMSALILQKQISPKVSGIDRGFEKLKSFYKILLSKSLNNKKSIVFSTVALLAVAIFTFSKMGGEFLPSLDEGDFAVETRLLTGSSLNATIEQSNKAADILIRNFPEVKQVVGKIGSPEIPTDPMPAEACDLMVILKPKDEWTSAHSRDELAEKMAEKLGVLPGVSFSFQQPIEMRFNELMSGIKQDVGIKIYGENLDTLSGLADEVAHLAQKTHGAVDHYVEPVEGLAQIVIQIDRQKMAEFGVDVASVNQAVNTAFAGQTAGIIYEGEKRFDLVVRLENENRQSLYNVENLFVTGNSGAQIPLSQLAKVEIKSGPNQIQRDDAKRRIIVGFNVRGRDVESIVNELQASITRKVKFPPGYYVHFGGEFQNLQEAKSRLAVVVPVALFVILLLLYFSFRSIRNTLLIFSCIPLAAIGGVFALWLRGMPFSISAGVGFIALFGVAVLNGIVLLAEFNSLKKEGHVDLKDRILTGANTRLRPILMTATVASLGFLPMAMATSAGSEVQKPLATVVMGGLITSTLLSLFVLPCLYLWLEGKFLKIKPVAALLLLVGFPFLTQAQLQPLTLPELIQKAKVQNRLMQAATKETESFQHLKTTAYETPKTDLNVMLGQYNSYIGYDNNLMVNQTMPWPGVMKRKANLVESQTESAKIRKSVSENELIFNLKSVHNQWLRLLEEHEILLRQDSLFQKIATAAERRHTSGEGTLLEKASAQLRQKEIRNQVNSNEITQKILLQNLAVLAGESGELRMKSESLQPLTSGLLNDSLSIVRNPNLRLARQQVEILENQKKLTQRMIAPQWNVGVFSQTLTGNPRSSDPTDLATGKNRFYGMNLGLSFPVFTKPYKARVKAEEKQKESQFLLAQHAENQLSGQLKQAFLELERLAVTRQYYQNEAMPNAGLVLKQAQIALQKGELAYSNFLVHLQQALQVQMGNIQTLSEHNQVVLQIEYLLGNN